MIELVLPWPSTGLSPNARLHWRKKAPITKSYKTACWAIAMEGKWPEFKWDGENKIHLWLTFYPPTRRHYDDDNVFASFKSGRDGLALALGIDDRFFASHPFLHTEIGGFVKARISRGPK